MCGYQRLLYADYDGKETVMQALVTTHEEGVYIS